MSVFQGSILGPFLFTTYVNGLSLHAPGAHVTQYADDTQILLSDTKRNIPHLIHHMETTLCTLSSWFHAHDLKFSASKIEILLLGNQQNTRGLSPVSVQVGGETVQESPAVKNVGLIFNCHHTWDSTS